ncbi:MAG: hypothetical protein GWN93_06655 [Deltaproteobacteria bacterium]|nr:hypothetical protein [Deltaproteobacteria bacterium]
MAATYEIWLTDDKGVRITSIANVKWFSATRYISNIARCTLSMPPAFDTSLLVPDRMIQFWRNPTGARGGLWQVYFIRGWRQETLGAQERIIITGVDANDILRRRIVAAFAGSEEAGKTDYADDMMKEVVTEAFADGVEPTPSAGTRVLANLSVQADLSNGPTLSKSFNWGRLLLSSSGGALADIAKASREAGTEVFFDTVVSDVSSSSIDFEFRTYTGQPGQDVSDRVVFDQRRGNLQNPFLDEDWSDEVNYVYAGGAGKGAARNVQQAYDASRYNVSQWNRCEAFADARDQTNDNSVREKARSLLEQGRPRRRFGGIPVDTRGTRFGIDWKFGDKVKARYKNEEFTMIIRLVTISVDDRGRETISARLDWES